jgi:hypothetical protein
MSHDWITPDEQKRLAQIRKDVEKHRAMGIDVSTWEAEFFLELVSRFRKLIPFICQ